MATYKFEIDKDDMMLTSWPSKVKVKHLRQIIEELEEEERYMLQVEAEGGEEDVLA